MTLNSNTSVGSIFSSPRIRKKYMGWWVWWWRSVWLIKSAGISVLNKLSNSDTFLEMHKSCANSSKILKSIQHNTHLKCILGKRTCHDGFTYCSGWSLSSSILYLLVCGLCAFDLLCAIKNHSKNSITFIMVCRCVLSEHKVIEVTHQTHFSLSFFVRSFVCFVFAIFCEGLIFYIITTINVSFFVVKRTNMLV